MKRRVSGHSRPNRKKSGLSDRQKDVLRIIVSSHIDSADPISSRFISRSLGLSSATIRNVMMDLEEMGYIRQPHTSAGRVPTDAGYRTYVDSLIEIDKLTAEQEDFIRDFYRRCLEEAFESKLEKTLNALAVLTRQTGLLFVPGLHLYVEGFSHMLNMPEFSDISRLRVIMRTLEEKTKLLELLNTDVSRTGVNVHIGSENGCDELSDMAIIDTTYRMDGTRGGVIGIIGPRRINYARLIPVLECMSEVLEDVF